MTDAQLRRRYRTIMTLLAVPPAAETVEDDLDNHRCAIEMEAARRNLDLWAAPGDKARWAWHVSDLLGTLVVLLFALALAVGYLGWPW